MAHIRTDMHHRLYALIELKLKIPHHTIRPLLPLSLALRVSQQCKKDMCPPRLASCPGRSTNCPEHLQRPPLPSVPRQTWYTSTMYSPDLGKIIDMLWKCFVRVGVRYNISMVHRRFSTDGLPYMASQPYSTDGASPPSSRRYPDEA